MANYTILVCGENVTGVNSSQGSNTWIVWVNDSAGNVNYSMITFNVDSIAPSVSFTAPSNASTVTTSWVTVNVSSSDDNLDTVTVLLLNSSGSLIYTNTSNSDSYEFNYTGLSEGSYYLNATVNDSAENSNSTLIYFTLDAYPDVVLSLPSNNTQSSLDIQTFYCNATSSLNLSSASLYIWNSTGGNISDANLTELSGVSNATSWSHNLSSEGTYYWNCLVNDTDGKETWGEENQTIILDVTVPGITLESPADGVSSTTSSYNFTFDLSDNYDINECKLIIDGSVSSTSSNVSKLVKNGIEASSIAVGTHIWSINCTDMAGNENSSESWTFTVSSSGGSSSPGGGGGGFPIYSVNEEGLKNGYNKLLQKSWKLRFSAGESYHTLEVKTISGNQVTIEIKSDPQTATLSLGEEKKFDVTGDNVYDLSVKLEDVIGNKVNLTIKSISEPVFESGEVVDSKPEVSQEEPLEDSIISPPEELPPKVSDAPSAYQWIVALIIIVVITFAIIILLKGNKKRKRKKKIFELSQF